MNCEESTVLLTDADELGLALAKRYVESKSRVIICGPRRDKLERARRVLPELCTIDCDISMESGRLSLFSRVTKKFPGFNVLVHNAESLGSLSLNNSMEWEAHKKQLAVNFEARIHLTLMFLPHLLKQPTSRIVSVKLNQSLEDYPIGLAAGNGLATFFTSLKEQLKGQAITIEELNAREQIAPFATPQLNSFF